MGPYDAIIAERIAQLERERSTPMDGLLSLVITAAVILGIFLAIRKLVLWYWRVNDAIRAIDNLTETVHGLKAPLEKIANHDVDLVAALRSEGHKRTGT